jgi:hypothetical protein
VANKVLDVLNGTHGGQDGVERDGEWQWK